VTLIPFTQKKQYTEETEQHNTISYLDATNHNKYTREHFHLQKTHIHGHSHPVYFKSPLATKVRSNQVLPRDITHIIRNFLYVSKQSRNKQRTLEAFVCFDHTCWTIINSLRFRLWEYLFICLFVLKSYHIIIMLNFINIPHKPSVALYFLQSTNLFLSLYLKLERPILKEPSVSSCYTRNLGSCDNSRINTFWMYFEYTGWELVSNSDSNFSALTLRRLMSHIYIYIWSTHSWCF